MAGHGGTVSRRTANKKLLSNPDLKLICFYCFYSTYLFRQRLCSRLTALWRFMNFVLLLIFNIIVYYNKNTDSQRHGKTILLLLVLLLTTTTKIITVHEKALPAYHFNYKK